MNPELVPFGTSIRDVLSHRGGPEDWELFQNVIALLMYSTEANGIEGLSDVERHVYAIGGMLRDVNNGGWEQFLESNDPSLTQDLVPALTAIGSVEFKSLAKEALAQVAGAEDEPPFWDVFDERFYACAEQLEPLALSFLQSNLSAVRT